jgi:hypothetical protein
MKRNCMRFCGEQNMKQRNKNKGKVTENKIGPI